MCQLKRKVPAKYEDPNAGQIVQIAGRQVWLSKPTAVEDDLTSLPLSAESTWQGMLKEVSALDSLEVGKPCNYGEARKYCDETGAKIVKSRFVFTDKADLDGSRIVRARLVAKDFAFHQPTALDLGIASQTASVEAFKGFLCRVVQDTLVLWGLDVSTAFLSAKLGFGVAFLFSESGRQYCVHDPRQGDLWIAFSRPFLAEASCSLACRVRFVFLFNRAYVV